MQRRNSGGMNARYPFVPRCTAMLQELGATGTDDFSYPWSLVTRAGELRLAVHEDWLACRFSDVGRAKAALDSDARLNPFSGKWNWHFTSPGSDAVDSLRQHLAALLPSPSVLGFNAGGDVGMDSPVFMARVQAKMDANLALQNEVPIAEAIATITARMDELFGHVPRMMVSATVSLVYAEAAAHGDMS